MQITLRIHELKTSEELEQVRLQLIEKYQDVSDAVGQSHEFNSQKYNLESNIKKMAILEKSLAHLQQHSEQLKEMGFDHEGKKLQSDIQSYWNAVVRGLRTLESFASGVTNAEFVLHRLKQLINERDARIETGSIVSNWTKECIDKLERHLRRQRVMLCEWESND